MPIKWTIPVTEKMLTDAGDSLWAIVLIIGIAPDYTW